MFEKQQSQKRHHFPKISFRIKIYAKYQKWVLKYLKNNEAGYLQPCDFSSRYMDMYNATGFKLYLRLRIGVK